MKPEEYEGEQIDPRCIVVNCAGVGAHICPMTDPEQERAAREFFDQHDRRVNSCESRAPYEDCRCGSLRVAALAILLRDHSAQAFKEGQEEMKSQVVEAAITMRDEAHKAHTSIDNSPGYMSWAKGRCEAGDHIAEIVKALPLTERKP